MSPLSEKQIEHQNSDKMKDVRKKYNQEWFKYSQRFNELKRLKKEESLKTSLRDPNTFPYVK